MVTKESRDSYTYISQNWLKTKNSEKIQRRSLNNDKGGVPLMAQRIKDLVLWCCGIVTAGVRVTLWCGFNHWSKNFRMLCVANKKGVGRQYMRKI